MFCACPALARVPHPRRRRGWASGRARLCPSIRPFTSDSLIPPLAGPALARVPHPHLVRVGQFSVKARLQPTGRLRAWVGALAPTGKAANPAGFSPCGSVLVNSSPFVILIGRRGIPPGRFLARRGKLQSYPL